VGLADNVLIDRSVLLIILSSYMQCFMCDTEDDV